ncbi:MAG: RimK family protein [Gammaproteobacteria bacterium]|nr:RimK family protein [Gammaproteobacteria bacterium]
MAEYLVLVENRNLWKAHFPDLKILTATDYLSDPVWAENRGLRIINLCRSHRYLGVGYYCSLLAEARGHKVIPGIRTLQDLRSKSLYSLDTDDLSQRVDQIMAKRGTSPDSSRFELPVLFGRSDVSDMQGFAKELFELFRAPLMTVEFRHDRGWRIHSIKSIALQALDESLHASFIMALEHYISSRWRKPRKRHEPRFDLAILHDPQEASPPSDKPALQLFLNAAKALDINAEMITSKDYGRLAEYDGLFIRATTSIDHYTYRFARKAVSEGLVVMDDPDSILRCTNKIYLAELLRANKVATPQTMILSRESLLDVEQSIPYPIVLKMPDGAFSRGVHKISDRAQLEEISQKLFKESELLLAQEYTYTEFDWRVGILNRQAIYVCQYFMSRNHWQIINHGKGGEEGTAATFAVADAPKAVVKTALRAANLIGDGLYGVDLKETDKGVLVIEVNDNPSIDKDVEDAAPGSDIYKTILEEFIRRMEAKRRGSRPVTPDPL